MPFKNYRKLVLPNGIRVVMEPDKNVCSIALGVLIAVGSKYERKEDNGISHFIEHLLFKGTKKRSTSEIAISIDQIGGQIDGGTSREYTHLEIKALSNHLEFVIDLLSDMVFNPRLDIKDIVNEKSVILEEIKMYEDTPDEFIQDMIVNEMWKDYPLGQPIIGTRETVSGFNRERVENFINSKYLPSNIIISCCGNFEIQRFIKLVSKYFNTKKDKREMSKWEIKLKNPLYGVKHIERDLNQVHCCMGFNGLSRVDNDRYVLQIINTILGSSMSSRLFQEVREKQGLVYSIYSYPVLCMETGLFIVYFATTKSNLNKAYNTVLREINNLKTSKISKDELQKAKEHLKGNILLSFEGTKSRMSILGRWELYYGRYFTVKEMTNEIDKITVEDVLRVARRLFKKDKSMTLTLGEAVVKPVV
ncbi:MAG: pitrilysin family protein [Candidatus Hydrogenedentota bacterium]